jgi:glycosyltransferase involved in cell wall biosynthesis
MRLALVSCEYPPETAHGGIATQTYMKAHGLARRGHEVHVISAARGTGRRYSDGPVHVTRVPWPEGGLPLRAEPARWLAYSFAVAAAVDALHADAPLDLVDFPEWGCEGYVHLLNRADWARVPTVIHLHGPLVMLAHTIGWPEVGSAFYRAGTAMEGTCLGAADAVFSSSACSADWCARHYGLACDAIPVLHTGVDTRLFRPQPAARGGRPTILFVGRVSASKSAPLLLEAAARLVRDYPVLRLRMVGPAEPELADELGARARALGCARLLELPGFVGRQDLPLELARADVFAAPSRYEGGPGFVYLEAMACGVPVIACAGSGAAEVVASGVNGLLVPPDDVEALTGALRQLLADDATRQAMGARARRYALAEADSEACLGRLEAFYQAVAARYGMR